MPNELGGGGSTPTKNKKGLPITGPGFVSAYLFKQPTAQVIEENAAARNPDPLGWQAAADAAAILGSGGGSSGGEGGYVDPAPMLAPSYDPLADPKYLAALAGIDTAESTAIGGARARQDAARRALDDLIGDIANREQKSQVRSKESQETRGLLRSGATERLLADVAEAAGTERAKGQSSTSDAIADLERQIAEAKVAASKQRADMALQYQGAGGVL